MAKARTWILVIFAGIGVIVVCLLALAGVSAYWVMRHINTQPATATSALKSFDAERARFGDQQPLVKLDDLDNAAALQRKIDDLPAGASPATEMAILVWDPREERTVRISLPFWLLKLGRNKIDIAGIDTFDYDRLRIDVNQLERVGPKLLADLQRPGGERVLVWTR